MQVRFQDNVYDVDMVLLVEPDMYRVITSGVDDVIDYENGQPQKYWIIFINNFEKMISPTVVGDITVLSETDSLFNWIQNLIKLYKK